MTDSVRLVKYQVERRGWFEPITKAEAAKATAGAKSAGVSSSEGSALPPRWDPKAAPWRTGDVSSAGSAGRAPPLVLGKAPLPVLGETTGGQRTVVGRTVLVKAPPLTPPSRVEQPGVKADGRAVLHVPAKAPPGSEVGSAAQQPRRRALRSPLSVSPGTNS